MPDRRDQIRMSDDELWDFLGSSRHLQVATLNRDGSPHLSTLWFALRDRAIVFDTYAKSQKALNLRRDPRIALLVEAGATYEALRGVSINGTARIVEPGPESLALKVRISRRYHPETAGEVLRAEAARTAGKRVVVSVTPGRVRSWDHRNLGLR